MSLYVKGTCWFIRNKLVLSLRVQELETEHSFGGIFYQDQFSNPYMQLCVISYSKRKLLQFVATQYDKLGQVS